MRNFALSLALCLLAFSGSAHAQAMVKAGGIAAACPSCNLSDATLTLSGNFASNVASGSDAITLLIGAKINFGGFKLFLSASTLTTDGNFSVSGNNVTAGQLISSAGAGSAALTLNTAGSKLCLNNTCTAYVRDDTSGNVDLHTAGTAQANGVVLAAGSSGAWTATTLTALAATTPYGGYQMAGTVGNGMKFGQVTCTTLTTAGTGTAGTLAIRNVTDSSTLCSGAFTCTTAKDVAAAVFNCNTAPLASKVYAIYLTAGCGTTNPTGLTCNVEILH